jgi:hypothetical protein
LASPEALPDRKAPITPSMLPDWEKEDKLSNKETKKDVKIAFIINLFSIGIIKLKMCHRGMDQYAALK